MTSKQLLESLMKENEKILNNLNTLQRNTDSEKKKVEIRQIIQENEKVIEQLYGQFKNSKSKRGDLNNNSTGKTIISTDINSYKTDKCIGYEEYVEDMKTLKEIYEGILDDFAYFFTESNLSLFKNLPDEANESRIVVFIHDLYTEIYRIYNTVFINITTIPDSMINNKQIRNVLQFLLVINI